MNRTINLRRHAPLRPSGRQSGFVLLIALIALVALTLAGLGLMRAITNDSAIAGNLTFRQSTINTGDTGLDWGVYEVVNDLLTADTNNANNPKSWNNQSPYYFANILEQVSATHSCPSSNTATCIGANGIPLRLLSANLAACPKAPGTGYTQIGTSTVYWKDGTAARMFYNTSTGNCAQVVIDRLCGTTATSYVGKAADSSNCILLSALQQNSTQYSQSHGGDAAGIVLQSNKVAVRVSVRVDGPRGTTSYLQALVGQKMM